MKKKKSKPPALLPMGGDCKVQYAALPFRIGANGVEIMLVSSRETRRWVLPKGWPIKGKKPHMVAAVEAFEEAGLAGKAEKKPVGQFHYVKRMRNGAALLCRVEVFLFHVEKQCKNWPERDQRTTIWRSLQEAADLVNEMELQELLLTLRPSYFDLNKKRAA